MGTDRQRNPERILAVLHELGADVIALQEVDRRFGRRETVLPRELVEERHWRVAALKMRPASMGWHGNAILVAPHVDVLGAEPIDLPAIEPRGAVCAHLSAGGREFCVVGMHLDLSGLLRRKQVDAVCGHIAALGKPAVMLGDLNEWSQRGGALRGFAGAWSVLQPGRSFPSTRPLAQLDRIVHSEHWDCEDAAVHHSALSAMASDHLPVKASLSLTA
ncbi:endonuclease [Altererythrobacter sp. B11]|uniref:endonuclease/exonuclease/phosphatase family protein n=1 Tax=Altererythrobacter sp. B11 TaxID=2060312 RepID=UPI000DC72CCE|nr:endonuclease/exonuclease/phosphatase family protein [Altererythrobacter sp. B11]BBC71576.1 endonuclease [Altererythrobacter sp. B11]